MSNITNLFKENEQKEENFTIEEDIDSSTIDTSDFFEPKEDAKDIPTEEEPVEENIPGEENEDNDLDPLTNVPAPKDAPSFEDVGNEFLNESAEVSETEWTGEDILSMITGVNEDGIAPAKIFVSLERLTGVTENMSLDDIPEENREVVEECEISDCTIDFFALNTEIANVVFNFEQANAVYLRDFVEILNRYRFMQEQTTEVGVIPMISIVIMPDDLKGKGAAFFSFPLAYFRTLNDNGVNASLHTMFYTENITFAKFDISKEEEAELMADALIEAEEEAGGMFTEES